MGYFLVKLKATTMHCNGINACNGSVSAVNIKRCLVHVEHPALYAYFVAVA
jgi:hypothetical protein